MSVFLDKKLWREQTQLAVVIVQEGRYSKGKGHCLIVPKRVVSSVWDLSPEEWIDMYVLLLQVRNRIEREYKPTGYRLTINEGKSANQTVPHVHIHVLPFF